MEASTYCTYYIPAQDLPISLNVHNSFLQTHVGGHGQPCQDHWFVLAKVQGNHTVPSHMASSPGNCGLQAELRACLRHVARTHVHKHQHVSYTLTGGRAFWPHRCSCVCPPLPVSFQNTNGPCLWKSSKYRNALGKQDIPITWALWNTDYFAWFSFSHLCVSNSGYHFRKAIRSKTTHNGLFPSQVNSPPFHSHIWDLRVPKQQGRNQLQTPGKESGNALQSVAQSDVSFAKTSHGESGDPFLILLIPTQGQSMQ